MSSALHAVNRASHAAWIDQKLVEDGKGSIDFYTQGQLVQIHGGVRPGPGRQEYESERIKKRGNIREFSPRSRMRLVTWCAKLAGDSLPLFVTLTYPGLMVGELLLPEKWKRDLDVFSKWLTRHWPGSCAIWKLEPQRCRICKPEKELKTLCTCGKYLCPPHYHLMIWGIPFLPHVDLARAWYRIVGSGQEDHLSAGIQVKRAMSKNGVMCYASKIYMGKDCKGFPGMVGKFWGIIGRKSFHMSVCETVEIKAHTTKLIRRVARRWLESKGIRVGHSKTLNLYTTNFALWMTVGEWACDETNSLYNASPAVCPF